MNLFELLFASLGVAIFIFGLFTNYSKNIFPDCVVQLFRYGRANISTNIKSSYISSTEVPKRWFYHFYSWAVILQFLVVLTLVYSYLFNGVSNSLWLTHLLRFSGERLYTINATVTIIGSSLFLFHLCRRLFETLFVAIYSNTKMNVLHYVLGYIHYTATIFSLVAHSPGFASSGTPTEYNINFSDIGIREILGVLIFLTGNYLQHRAHVGLANLRKGKDKKEARTHKIPQGELFEFISCPNYFAEIVIYCGLVVLTGFQNSSYNFCTFWVISNQIIAGIMNHLWYIETFSNYPKHRKAIIPFIW